MEMPAGRVLMAAGAPDFARLPASCRELNAGTQAYPRRASQVPPNPADDSVIHPLPAPTVKYQLVLAIVTLTLCAWYSQSPYAGASLHEPWQDGAAARSAGTSVLQFNGDVRISRRQQLNALACPLPVSTAATNASPAPQHNGYFNLAVEYRGQVDAPYIHSELTPQVDGIYHILSELLGPQRLRKVDLKLALYPDRDSYVHYAGTVTGRDMSHSGGFYSKQRNEAVTYVHASAHQTLELLKHESTHALVTAVLGAAPKWLNEGLAEYFSMLSIAGHDKEVRVKTAWLKIARESTQRGYFSNLDALLTLDAEGWRRGQMENHYALSWALVYFLMSSDAGKASIGAMLQQFADHYCQPMDSVAALGNRYPGGTAQLQQDFYSWLGDEAAGQPHYYQGASR
jgi:hypothetical protein